MYAENRVIDSRKVKDLTERGFNNSLRIPLSDTFTRSIMPANRSHISAPEMAKIWPHLKTIAESLMPVSQYETGLLIDTIALKLSFHAKLFPPDEDGPFGQRTDLGWGIVGVIDPGHIENDTIGVSHRVIALEVPPSLSTVENPHSNLVLFSLKTKVKKVVGTDVRRIMEHDRSCDKCDGLFTGRSKGLRFA